MDITILNSIIKGQYSIVDKANYKIMIRSKMYDVDDVIRDLSRTIEELEKHVFQMVKMFDLEIITEIEK